MTTPEELRAHALSLYEQGEEHFAEANRIVHELVFKSETFPLDGPLAEDLVLLAAGLIHGAWNDRELFFDEAVHRMKMILWRESSHRSVPLMDFIVVDHLRGWGEFATALKVLQRVEVDDDQRSMWLRRNADCEFRMGNRSKGLEIAWQAVMNNPADSISHRVYGTYLFESGDRVPALMAHAFAIGLEHKPVMLQEMQAELINCMNIESMSVGDGKLTIDTSTMLFPGIGGGRLNPEFLFFEMSITMIRQAYGTSGEASLHRPLMGHVIDSICRYSSTSLDESPEEFNGHTEPFKFYTPFFASLKRAVVVEEFTDHLYRTTHVSEASAYDPDDRFRIKAYAFGGDPLPERPGWRERDDADDDDEDHDDAEYSSSVSESNQWLSAADKDNIETPTEQKEINYGRYFYLLIPLALILLRLCT